MMEYSNLIPKEVAKQTRMLFIAPGNLAGDFSNVPLGIATLASILLLNNVYVIVKDYSVEQLDLGELKRIIKDNNINIVGITMMTCQATVGYRIAEFIKSNFTDVTVVSGGIHPTVLPEESLKNSIDIVYRGEAEISFPKSIPYIINTDYRGLKEIRGLTFKYNDELYTTPEAERITKLDNIPLPAYQLFKFPHKYTTQFLFKRGYSTNLITSRGCTGHCVFCSKYYQGVYYQSPERIVNDIIFLKDKYGVTQFFLQDDLFTYDIDRVIKFCDILIKEKIDIHWVCSNTRADTVTEELFKKMKKSGCISVGFGVESGNEEVRRKIGKNLKTEDIVRAVKLAKSTGLLTSAFYIFGHHCETYQQAFETIDFSIKLNTDTVTYSVNCPYPGTTLFKMDGKKIKILTYDWDRYRTWGKPVMETEFLAKDLIVKLQKLAYRRYYFRMNYIYNQIKNMIKYKNIYMYQRGFKWLIEQYFDYRRLSKYKPEHLRIYQ
ncbi:MAG: radical SAM protein [Candidatus Hydrogenedentota bacterium]